MQIEVNSERWLDLKDLEGEVWRFVYSSSNGKAIYLVSNLGRVKKEERGVRPKILRQFKNWRGYWRVHIAHLQPFVHRLVATAFVKKTSALCLDVDHRNAIRTDNRATNLHWVTRSQNMLNPITMWERKEKEGLVCGEKPAASQTTDFISEEEGVVAMLEYLESKRGLMGYKRGSRPVKKEKAYMPSLFEEGVILQ